MLPSCLPKVSTWKFSLWPNQLTGMMLLETYSRDTTPTDSGEHMQWGHMLEIHFRVQRAGNQLEVAIHDVRKQQGSPFPEICRSSAST